MQLPVLIMNKTTHSVSIMVLQKASIHHAHSWCWPAKLKIHNVCYTDLVDTLPTPNIIPGTDNFFSIPQMFRYWW